MSMLSFGFIVYGLAVCFYLVIGPGVQCVRVDADHLRKYPKCGKLGQSLGRMVNLKAADIHYPWVIRVVRLNVRKDPTAVWKRFSTGGAIITKRYEHILL